MSSGTVLGMGTKIGTLGKWQVRNKIKNKELGTKIRNIFRITWNKDQHMKVQVC